MTGGWSTLNKMDINHSCRYAVLMTDKATLHVNDLTLTINRGY